MAESPAAPPLGEVEFRLDFHSQLVEEAVLLAIEQRSFDMQVRFRTERDPIYEIEDPEDRQRRFEETHNRWFVELGLVEIISRCLKERPVIGTETVRALVVPVISPKEEYADLVRPLDEPDRPRLLVRVRVARLVDPKRLAPWLRRELLFVADLLDPEFGFDSDSQAKAQSRALTKLHHQRYRVLWETTVDGRLLNRGWLPQAVELRSWRKFQQTFPVLGRSGEQHFDRFFSGARPSHPEMLAFAARPAAGGDDSLASADGCPLCQMPAATLSPNPESLALQVQQAIRADFTGWQPENGLCAQCADLYEARLRSRMTP